MDLGLIAMLAAGYAVLSGISKAAKRNRADRQPERAARRPPRPTGRAPETLEELLAEMRRAASAEHTTVAVPRELPGWSEESLERPVVESIRAPVNLEDESIAVVARRRHEVEVREEGRRSDEHELFDKRIRAAAQPVAQPGDGLDRLRRAMLWNEVLGLPKGLQRN